MKPALLILLIFILQETPFKPKEEFDIKIDLRFKERPVDRATVYIDKASYTGDKSLLPYLTLHVKLLKVMEATKVRITHNQSTTGLTRKVQDGTELPLQFGFTDDVKDRVTPHEYTLSFLSADKNVINKIVISIAQDGAFEVNGERRGKF